jgi:hypothetical protein
MKILIQNEIFVERPDMSGRLPNKFGKPYWNPLKRLDISGVQNQTLQFTKPDTPVLAGQTTNHKFIYFRIFYEKASTIFSMGNKSFQFKHL